MEVENKTIKPIQSVLNAMIVGDKEYFPAHQLGSVRTTCSNMSFRTNKLFRTHTDRVNKIIIVTRVK